MDILVACHCKSKINNKNLHDTLFYYEVALHEDGPLTLENETPVNDKFNVEYLDIDACKKENGQYSKWADVPNHSKDLILAYNCSLYVMLLRADMWVNNANKWKPHLNDESTLLLGNLLNDGWNILKPGGSILIPVDTVMKNFRGGKNFVIEDALQHQKKNLALSVRHLSNKPWLVRSHMVKDLPFVIGIKSELKHIEKYAYLSITKPRGGGGRKTRSRRSRSRTVKRRSRSRTPKQVG